MTALLSVPEAARRLGLAESRVRVLCAAGRLGQRVGGRYVISEEDLRRFARMPRRPGRPREG